MFKLVVAGLAAVSAYAQTDIFDLESCHKPQCRIKVSYPGRNCNTLYDRFVVMINAFHNEDPGEGTYDLLATNPQKTVINAKRTSQNKGEVDAVSYVFHQVGKDCHVKGESSANHPVVFHPENAYCSIWDVLKYSDVFTTINVENCSYVPKNPDTECCHYPKKTENDFLDD